jgi:hypothetical protein
MALPTYDEAYEAAADKPAFSNGFEADHWFDHWCGRCTNDEGEFCPLVGVAMMDRTPAQWTEKNRSDLGNQYECSEFTPAK